jgi:hypothetical protein
MAAAPSSGSVDGQQAWAATLPRSHVVSRGALVAWPGWVRAAARAR